MHRDNVVVYHALLCESVTNTINQAHVPCCCTPLICRQACTHSRTARTLHYTLCTTVARRSPQSYWRSSSSTLESGRGAEGTLAWIFTAIGMVGRHPEWFEGLARAGAVEPGTMPLLIPPTSVVDGAGGAPLGKRRAAGATAPCGSRSSAECRSPN